MNLFNTKPEVVLNSRGRHLEKSIWRHMSVVGNPIGNPIWVKLGSLMQNNMPTTVITVWTVVQTVLTETFNSYEIDKIQPPPTKSIPLNRPKKTRHSWLRPWDDPLYQIRYKYTHWGFLGKWVKYITKNIFLFLYTFFLRLAYRSDGRPVDGFLRAIAQKTWNHARMCHCEIIKLYLSPKTVKFWPKTGQFFSTENA